MKELYCPSSHHKVCLEIDQQRGNVMMKHVFSLNSYHMFTKGTVVLPSHYPSIKWLTNISVCVHKNCNTVEAFWKVVLMFPDVLMLNNRAA